MSSLLLVVALSASVSAQQSTAAKPNRPASVWIGSTPCGDELRAFLGGIAADAKCHAIRWRLAFEGEGASQHWRLTATYGVPPASNPNQMVDGPSVTAEGQLQVLLDEAVKPAPTIYIASVENPHRSLRFLRVSDGLLHLQRDNGALMVGTAGWSYSLSRADLAERPGTPSTAPDMSYTISPKATGSSVFGIFEGRTPCMGIAQVINARMVDGCLKVKWRVTLERRAGSTDSGTYKIESSLHRERARTGNWRIVRGTPSNPDAIIYQLDASGTERVMQLLRGDDNVLFFLNPQRQPLIGNAEFGYALNRVTGG